MAARGPAMTKRFDGAEAARIALLLVLAAVVLLPLAATVLGGFKTLGELRTRPLALPEAWQWQQHAAILSSLNFWRQLGNSVLVAALTVVLTLVVAAPAAFAFVRLRFAFARRLLGFLLLGLLFPAATAVLPLFIRIRDLGLLDSLWGVVLPQVAFGLAAAVLMLRNAFDALPRELFEAALMDHCGPWRCFTRIVLPLSRPILATVAVIAAVQSWNAYLLPLVVLNRESLYPWPLGLMAYQGQYSTDWQLVLAFVTLTLLPMVAAFLLAQRHIVAGLTAGAVKG